MPSVLPTSGTSERDDDGADGDLCPDRSEPHHRTPPEVRRARREPDVDTQSTGPPASAGEPAPPQRRSIAHRGQQPDVHRHGPPESDDSVEEVLRAQQRDGEHGDRTDGSHQRQRRRESSRFGGGGGCRGVTGTTAVPGIGGGERGGHRHGESFWFSQDRSRTYSPRPDEAGNQCRQPHQRIAKGLVLMTTQRQCHPAPHRSRSTVDDRHREPRHGRLSTCARPRQRPASTAAGRRTTTGSAPSTSTAPSRVWHQSSRIPHGRPGRGTTPVGCCSTASRTTRPLEARLHLRRRPGRQQRQRRGVEQRIGHGTQPHRPVDVRAVPRHRHPAPIAAAGRVRHLRQPAEPIGTDSGSQAQRSTSSAATTGALPSRHHPSSSPATARRPA